MKEMVLKRKDGCSIRVVIKKLDSSYIDEIMDLQNNIYEGLLNKDFYACSDKEEFENILINNGTILGCLSSKDNKLIAMGVYVEYGYEKHNYGYDIDIQGDSLLKVGQLESTVVSEEFRGNRLQRIICEELESICIGSGKEYICATVAPMNKFSLNTFINLGYKIMVEKQKYGGLNRYVLMKKF